MMFTKVLNRNKGFTLIELLVVIAIIGILSSVVLASLSTARAKSRDAKRISDMGQIQLGLEVYFDASQSYPQTAGQTASTITVEGAIATLVASSSLPLAPVGPNNTKYRYRGTYMSGATLTECVSQTANPCTGYGLMVNLEKNDNVVLTTDADQTLTGLVGTYTDTAAAGAPGGKLNTTSDKCEATMSTGGVEQCYDLKP